MDSDQPVPTEGGADNFASPGTGSPPTGTWDRVKAILRLEQGIFAGIARDQSATPQALVVFLLATSAGSIWLLFFIPIVLAVAFVGIAVEALIFMVVSRLFSNTVPKYDAWLRSFLFASAPNAISILPFVGWLIALFYALVLAVLVVRDLTQVSTVQSVLVVILSAVVPMLLLTFLVALTALPFLLGFLRDAIPVL